MNKSMTHNEQLINSKTNTYKSTAPRDVTSMERLIAGSKQAKDQINSAVMYGYGSLVDQSNHQQVFLG